MSLQPDETTPHPKQPEPTVAATSAATATASGTAPPRRPVDRASNRITRHSEAGQLLETFLVAGIVTVLVTRWLLGVAGYPRIGGGGIHIAHLLWGGLLMVSAIVLVFLFLDRRVQHLAALLSGIGFGLFVDEVGKFLTTDNDYFFRPALALIYVAFVALFLVLRAVLSGPALTSRESLANAMDLLIDGVDGTIERAARARIELLLHHVDPDHPLRAPLHAYVDGLENRGWLLATIARLERRPAHFYERAVANPWFERATVFVVSGYAVLALASVGYVAFIEASTGTRDITEIAETISTIVGALLVVRGLVELPRSRYRAYNWFARGVLVWMLVTQVFVFYSSQLAGIGGLAADLLAYAVLRFMIRREVAAGRGPAPRQRTAVGSWRNRVSRLVPRRRRTTESFGSSAPAQPEPVRDEH